MSGQYIFVENPISPTPSKLEKQRISPMSAFMRREGLALELPFERRETDHRYPDKKVETLPIPLKNVTFDPVVVDREKRVLEVGEVSVLNWLARLAIAGFSVHNTASEAQAAQNEAANGQTITAALAQFKALGYPKVTMANLVGFLAKEPRGANLTFDEATVTKVVSSYLGFGAGSHGFAAAIAQAFLANASGWKGDSERPVTPELRAEVLCDALSNVVTPAALLALTETTIPEALADYGLASTSLSCVPQLEEAAALEAMSASSGVLEAGLSVAAFRLGDPSEAVTALVSSGPTFNGLSWLLNPKKGLALWARGDAEAISQHFGCPLSLVERLKLDAQRILNDYAGSFGNLHDLRNQIGGGLASFGDRYFSRLADLADSASQVATLFDSVPFPESLLDASSERAFWGTGFTANDLKSSWDDVVSGLAAVNDGIASLRGVGVAPTPALLDDLENRLDRVRQLFGHIRLVLNNIRVWSDDIEAARGRGNFEVSSAGEAALTRISIPDQLVSSVGFKGWVSRDDVAAGAANERGDDAQSKVVSVDPISLPFLARRRVSSDAVRDVLNRRQSELKAAVALSQGLAADLLGNSSLVEVMLKTFEQQDRRHYENRGATVDDRFLALQSRRHFLDEWFRFWSSLSRPAVDYAQKELVGLDLGYSDDLDNQDSVGWRNKAHAFLQEGKGCLWKGMFAKGRHKPYGVNSDRLLAADLDALSRRMSDWMATQYAAEGYASAEVDYHALCAKQLEMSARVTSQSLPTNHPALQEWPLPATFRPAEQARLARPEPLSGREIARVAGRLAVSIRDAASFVHRQTHLDRAAFKPVKALESLGYLGKTKTADGEVRYWCPPERLWVADSPASTLLRSMMSERESVPVADLLAELGKLAAQADETQLGAILALLKELPHTWGIVTSLPGLQGGSDWPMDAVLMIGKKSVAKAPRQSRVYPMSLTPLRANLLDECLTGDRVHMPGNITLHYAYDRRNDYVPEVKRAEVHIPTSKVAAPAPDKATSPYLDRLIGIDLGERGVGFSVREVRQPNSPLVARGMVPVPAIRKLISATRKFRQRHQKAMSVRTSHVNFEEMREAVAGNVISVIKYLMWHYKALPVLEMDLSNLNKGQRQLSHVYNAVADAFISRGVPTVDKARTNTWRGFRIEHPYLDRVAVDPKSKATSVVPFKLFPGTGVRAANTSKICSGCGVNPIKALREHSESRVALDDQGCVALDGGVTLQFFTPASINAVAAGEGAPVPLANRILTITELRSHLNNNQLRIRPASAQSKDTSQSRYWCANKDCQHHRPDYMLHADMNAADNIVLRRCRTLIPKDTEAL